MTVMARLFVRKANNRVGTIAMSVSQFTPIESLLLSMTLSTTRAVRIQIGIKESHLSTGAGNCKLRTTKNGRIRGITVTNVQPSMRRRMDRLRLIYQSPPQ